MLLARPHHHHDFHHLLEQHRLARQLFKTINRWLAEAGVMMTCDEIFVSADAGDQGAAQCEELVEEEVDWLMTATCTNHHQSGGRPLVAVARLNSGQKKR